MVHHVVVQKIGNKAFINYKKILFNICYKNKHNLKLKHSISFSWVFYKHDQEKLDDLGKSKYQQ